MLVSKKGPRTAERHDWLRMKADVSSSGFGLHGLHCVECRGVDPPQVAGEGLTRTHGDILHYNEVRRQAAEIESVERKHVPSEEQEELMRLTALTLCTFRRVKGVQSCQEAAHLLPTLGHRPSISILPRCLRRQNQTRPWSHGSQFMPWQIRARTLYSPGGLLREGPQVARASQELMQHCSLRDAGGKKHRSSTMEVSDLPFIV